MKNTIYVLAEGDAVNVFNQEFALFQQGEGWYFDNEFTNWGDIIPSLDGTKRILEEEQSKFKSEHLAREDVTVFTEEEFHQYLQDNRAEWEPELDD